MRTFERYRGARKRRTRILAKLYHRLKHPRDFIFRSTLTQKILLRSQENFLLCGAFVCENIGANSEEDL